MIRGVILATLLLCLSLPASSGVLEHTAVNAFRDLSQLPGSDQWEYSGYIVSRQGAIYYTMFPHTDQKSDSVSFDIKAHMIPGDVLVAIYHNHPCHSTTHFTGWFSTSDLISAKFHDVPTFMLDNCTGLVHEFDWKKDKVHDTGDDLKVRFPNGTERWVHLPTGRIVGDLGRKLPNLDKPKP